MSIATWNVNSARARLPRLLAWLEQHSPDVVCLQEVKCVDEQFPAEPIEALGYHVETFGQKTYNGVAILSKDTPDDVVRGFPDDAPDAQARAIAATVRGYRVLNLYVVNGKQVGDVKYDYKLRWLDSLTRYVHAAFDMGDKLVLTGDFNITFDDRDLYDPDGWRDKILCSPPEREALAALMAPGLVDAFREFEPEGGHYSWFDFRTRGFQRGNGLRIDHFLLSPPAMAACTGVSIDLEERGQEKPSDHAPVVARFA
ncbi:MAG: exodeoxyribonuclease III [Planctomycetota bacterium]|nr:MAG: exodeoxyribonuclease III [Planctomycetota bacterium]